MDRTAQRAAAVAKAVRLAKQIARAEATGIHSHVRDPRFRCRETDPAGFDAHLGSLRRDLRIAEDRVAIIDRCIAEAA
jgi:hypothetical protein